MSTPHLESALRKANDAYNYLCSSLNDAKELSSHDYHTLAVKTLFQSFATIRLSVNEIVSGLTVLDNGTDLYKVLIHPFTKIIDDVELIAKEYGELYIKYLSDKSQGYSDDEAIEKLFVLYGSRKR